MFTKDRPFFTALEQPDGRITAGGRTFASCAELCPAGWVCEPVGAALDENPTVVVARSRRVPRRARATTSKLVSSVVYPELLLVRDPSRTAVFDIVAGDTVPAGAVPVAASGVFVTTRSRAG